MLPRTWCAALALMSGCVPRCGADTTPAHCEASSAETAPAKSALGRKVWASIRRGPDDLTASGLLSERQQRESATKEWKRFIAGLASQDEPKLEAVWSATSQVPTPTKLACGDDAMVIERGPVDRMVMFYDKPGTPLSHRVTFVFDKKDDDYELILIAEYASRDRGKSAADYMTLGGQYAKVGSDIDALIAFMAAAELSQEPPVVETAERRAILAKIESFTKAEQLLSKELVARDDPYIELGVAAVSNAGIVPRVTFVTPAEGEATSVPARALGESFLAATRHVRQDYPLLFMSAIKDPARKSESVRTVIPLDSWREP